MQPLATDRGVVTGSFSLRGRHLPYAREPGRCSKPVDPRAPQASDGGPCADFPRDLILSRTLISMVLDHCRQAVGAFPTQAVAADFPGGVMVFIHPPY